MSIEESLAELLRSQKAYREQLPDLLRRAIREEAEAARASEIIGCAELAVMLGAKAGKCTLAELGRKRAERDNEILALRLTGGDGHAHYRWRRRDIEELLARRRHDRKMARRA